jgi:predicted MFS family arabinose efflux permease
MLQQVDPLWISAFKRGLRTFVQAFLGVYGVSNLIGALSGSQPIDTSALRAAGVAGILAVIAIAWRAFVDPLPVPTLSDTQAADHTG